MPTENRIIRSNPIKESLFIKDPDPEPKRRCPMCNAVESGELRIITHNHDCKHRTHGGRKNRKPTKKNRRRTRRSLKKH